MSIYFYTEDENTLQKDWPWPVSRITSEGGIKKSFLFDPENSGEFKRF